MKYKLLVLDVDGTLLNNQKEISPRTLAALLKVQQMGVHIVLASGRPTNGVMPIAEKLELNHYGGYILSYNGGQIINVQTGELLFEKRIDPEWVPYFEKKAKKNDFAIFTYHKDFILTDKPDNKYVIQEANLNKMQIVGVDNFAEAVDFPPCKCMLASDDEEALIGLENHWKKRLDGVLDAFRSEPYFLEVVPQFIDKGNTLGVLMTKLSVSPEEVIAIGDGVCDVTMLQLAGVGIAMGNAEDSVKACVDKTTPRRGDPRARRASQPEIVAEQQTQGLLFGADRHPAPLSGGALRHRRLGDDLRRDHRCGTSARPAPQERHGAHGAAARSRSGEIRQGDARSRSQRRGLPVGLLLRRGDQTRRGTTFGRSGGAARPDA